MVKQQQRYADIVRQRMKTGENSTGKPLSIREVARTLGYSYEHIRKVISGEPVASKEFNNSLAKLLNLSPDIMWAMAQREKANKKFDLGLPIAAPEDPRMATLWMKLTPEERDRIITIAEAYILERELATKKLPFAVGTQIAS